MRKKAPIMLSVLVALFLSLSLASSQAVAANVIVPYSSSGVTSTELDGNPATGNWTDAIKVVVPLENGAASPYGSLMGYVKHDGTNLYVRLDGKVDVPWVSATGSHFWLAWLFGAATVTGHHRAGHDLVLFGDTSYTGVGYPLTPIDAYGGGKPPAKDVKQDVVGMVRYTGASAPYSFTAEFQKPLNSNDSQDIVLVADGTSSYIFAVTTDSDGGGSQGGSLDHSVVTNNNVLKLAPAVTGGSDGGGSVPVPPSPPSESPSAPAGPPVGGLSGERQILWVLTVLAALSMVSSFVVLSYLFIRRSVRTRKNG